jgi:hypothetical protein
MGESGRPHSFGGPSSMSAYLSTLKQSVLWLDFQALRDWGSSATFSDEFGYRNREAAVER